jgi:type IV secretory pathway protease TraF
LLPAWKGCRTLRAGEVFLLNPNIPDSFDGRYFGPLSAAAITARAEPLWIIGKD